MSTDSPTTSPQIRRPNKMPLLLAACALIGLVLVIGVTLANMRQDAYGSQFAAEEVKAAQGPDLKKLGAMHEPEVLLASMGTIPNLDEPPRPPIEQEQEQKPAGIGGGAIQVASVFGGANKTKPVAPVPGTYGGTAAQAAAEPSTKTDSSGPASRTEAEQEADTKAKAAMEAATAEARLAAAQADRDRLAQIRQWKLERYRKSLSAPMTVEGGESEGAKTVEAELASVRERIKTAAAHRQSGSYEEKLAAAYRQIKASGMGPTPSAQSAASGANKNAYAQFDKKEGEGDRWSLGASVKTPDNPYMVLASDTIPGTLITAINSDLAGKIIGQVARDVRSTTHMQHILIPQGTKLFGEYQSEVAQGQKRILVAWQRLIFPDGRTLDIGAMPGTDGLGRAGLHDQVDNHYFERFFGAIMMSGISAGVGLSQVAGGSAQPTFAGTLSQALGQNLGQAGTELIKQNMSIAPTLEIRPGYSFRIIVTKDMDLERPYKAFDYKQ